MFGYLKRRRRERLRAESFTPEMDHHTVRRLEDEIEKAVAAVIMRLGEKRLPLLPSQRTMHLMAKAAVAVYEAAAESYQPQVEDHHGRRPEP